jgi:hypothetical protein
MRYERRYTSDACRLESAGDRSDESFCAAAIPLFVLRTLLYLPLEPFLLAGTATPSFALLLMSRCEMHRDFAVQNSA